MHWCSSIYDFGEKKKVKQFDHSRLKKKNRNEDKLRWKGKWERPLNCDKSSLLIYVKYERRKEHALSAYIPAWIH